MNSILSEDTDTNDLLELAEQELSGHGLVKKKIAILSGYTSKYIAQLIRLFSSKHGVLCEVFESEYGTFEQLIYARSEELGKFKPDICYFLVGTDHLGNASAEAEADRWLRLWKTTHDWLGCEIIQNNFEEPVLRAFGNHELRVAQSKTSFVRAVNAQILKMAQGFVHFNDVDFLASLHGRKQWRDETFYDLSKIPVAFNFLGAYAANVARIIASLVGKTKKCLVLDLDNTLWGGVIGDDGLSGIDVLPGSAQGEAFQRFQKYIKQLKDRGVILAVCSKNEKEIAEEPFLKIPEMVLKLDDISCFVANWDPKPDNIRKIAKQLNIGLDSMVFVDDNPAERELVRRSIPEIAVLDMPENPADYAAALDRAAYFEITALTDEDLKRTEMYRSNLQRQTLEEKIEDYGDFLKELQMEAKLARFDAANLPRITQLINKTNQFNLTTKRYLESEVENLMKSESAITFYLKLTDRFGDNGLVSAFIGIVEEPATLAIDCWLMSCRVLKREVEDFLLQNVVQECKARGIKCITGTYRPTPKNAMVKDLLGNFGFTRQSADADGATHWLLDLSNHEATHRILERFIAIRMVS